MTRPALVLRPAPGNAATAAALERAGIVAHRVPLFAVRPVAWDVPDGTHDAILLTSANAVRHGGATLARLRHLPVVAVGDATARAARAAGFAVAHVGTAGVAAAVAGTPHGRLLHLAGRERVAMDGVAAVTVYASDAIDLPAGALTVASGAVALLHSARAAQRFAALADRDGVARAAVRLAALSVAVAVAAGTGWDAVAIAARRADAAVVAAAVTLAIDR